MPSGDCSREISSAAKAAFMKSINAAARVASAGKYFGWVDSDDGIAPTALAETAALLDAREPEVGMAYTDYLVMDVDGKIKGPGTRTRIPYSRERLLIDFMTFHFRLMRRETFDAVGMLDESAEARQAVLEFLS